MIELQRLHASHAAALLEFEVSNRAFFARTVPDRGDAYFADFAARHAASLTWPDCRLHVLVDGDGPILGRFNLVDIADGCAELGFRVASRATGRGLAKLGVRRVAELARSDYGLRRLVAGADPGNTASLAVLRATGFTATDADRYILELTP